ncbi:hypothetical protein B0H12DRAFT_1093030, partial [Mycena haematopus]
TGSCLRACVDFGDFGAEGRGVDCAVNCNVLPLPIFCKTVSKTDDALLTHSRGRVKEHSLSAERMSERDKNTTLERNVERTTHAIVPIAAVTGTTRFCICIPTSSDARMSGSQAVSVRAGRFATWTTRLDAGSGDALKDYIRHK